jgi:hypothetical protein
VSDEDFTNQSVRRAMNEWTMEVAADLVSVVLRAPPESVPSLHHCTSTILWRIEAARGNAATIITCIYWALRQHRRVEKIGLLLSLDSASQSFWRLGRGAWPEPPDRSSPSYQGTALPSCQIFRFISTTASIFWAYAYTATCSFRRSSDPGFLEPRGHDQCRAKC